MQEDKITSRALAVYTTGRYPVSKSYRLTTRKIPNINGIRTHKMCVHTIARFVTTAIVIFVGNKRGIHYSEVPVYFLMK